MNLCMCYSLPVILTSLSSLLVFTLQNRAGLRQFLDSFGGTEHSAMGGNAISAGHSHESSIGLVASERHDSKPRADVKLSNLASGIDSGSSIQTTETRLADLLDNTLWNRKLAPSSERIVYALVQQIFHGIREYFLASTELKVWTSIPYNGLLGMFMWLIGSILLILFYAWPIILSCLDNNVFFFFFKLKMKNYNNNYVQLLEINSGGENNYFWVSNSKENLFVQFSESKHIFETEGMATLSLHFNSFFLIALMLNAWFVFSSFSGFIWAFFYCLFVLQFNCFLLMPVVDKLPALLRHDLESAFEDDLDNVFDITNLRHSFSQQKLDVEIELKRVFVHRFSFLVHYFTRETSIFKLLVCLFDVMMILQIKRLKDKFRLINEQLTLHQLKAISTSCHWMSCKAQWTKSICECVRLLVNQVIFSFSFSLLKTIL